MTGRRDGHLQLPELLAIAANHPGPLVTTMKKRHKTGRGRVPRPCHTIYLVKERIDVVPYTLKLDPPAATAVYAAVGKAVFSGSLVVPAGGDLVSAALSAICSWYTAEPGAGMPTTPGAITPNNPTGKKP